MDNWPLNDNRAHSNWTGRTLRTDNRPGLFVDVKDEKAPHWAIQAGILILMIVGLLAACYL